MFLALRTGHKLTNNLYEGSIYRVLIGSSTKQQEYHLHRVKYVFHKTKSSRSYIYGLYPENAISRSYLHAFTQIISKKKTLANNNAVNMQK
jgi:hypothetical protein